MNYLCLFKNNIIPTKITKLTNDDIKSKSVMPELSCYRLHLAN